MATADDAPEPFPSSADHHADTASDLAPGAAAGLPTFEDLEEAVTRICAAWNAAEHDIKIAEQIGGAVIVPSINELRYAGRRFVEAQEHRTQDGDPAKADRCLGDAYFACLRARHDAIDATVSKIAKDLAAAVDSFGYPPISRAFPRYAELKRMVIDVHAEIAVSRGNRRRREAIYDSLSRERFEQLVELFRDFQVAEEAIVAFAEEERHRRDAEIAKEAAAQRRHRLTVLLACIGLLVALMTGRPHFFKVIYYLKDYSQYFLF